MAGDYSLDGLAVPASLEELHELLERVGTEHPQVAAEDLMMLETALVEVAANVIDHGRPAGSVLWTVRLAVRDDRLECLLSDTAQPADVDLGAASLPEDPESEHGRGLVLARAALDRLEHVRVAGGNVWRLVRLRR
ncbi:ATP-binding protein [Auraticoccus sp. F435]|uniref:ATP-binding protein n=1 Tax=Auraticoccus cholistanensis TaxID=2656650 RepID=A0A6A9UVB4_9ACTN|nr:ATP-binding protein [Auraticoccus cholistanensis]MVA76783.1 ATP-binding protein [Auraticoccus cholistanensis]